MKKVDAYIIESYVELEKLSTACHASSCSKCIYEKSCFERDAIWTYLDIMAPSPEFVMFKLRKGKDHTNGC